MLNQVHYKQLTVLTFILFKTMFGRMLVYKGFVLITMSHVVCCCGVVHQYEALENLRHCCYYSIIFCS